jgi:hypothetical protein
MFIFSLFAFFAALASAADVITTSIAMRRGLEEANTLLYGSRPSLRRLIVVGSIFWIAFTVIGAIAFSYGDLFASVVLFVVLAGLRSFAAVNNARLLFR